MVERACSVIAFPQGVLRNMLFHKTRATIALLTVGLLACATISAPVDPQPLAKGPNKLVFNNPWDIFQFDPDGKNEKNLSEQFKDFPADMIIGEVIVGEDKLRMSPDGQRLAAVLFHKRKGGFTYTSAPGTLYVLDNATWIDLKHPCLTAAWSPDGQQVATTNWDTHFNLRNKQRVTTSHLVNVKTKEKEKINLPDNHVINDWTRDGKQLLTYSITMKENQPKSEMTRLHLMNLDGTEHKALTEKELNVHSCRISPDKTRVLCLHHPEPVPRRGEMELLVLDIASGTTTKVCELPDRAILRGFCWSPDGKQIAYTYAWWEADKENPARAPAEISSFVILCDRDGKNSKTISVIKKPWGKGSPITGIDWR